VSFVSCRNKKFRELKSGETETQWMGFPLPIQRLGKFQSRKE